MQSSGAGSVAVVDDEARLIGIFTGRDAVCRVLAVGREPARTRLAEAMTPRIVGVVSRGDFKGLEVDCHEAERDLREHMR